MTARAPSFSSEPKIQFLTSVLEDLRKGMIEVPRFQRPFVWSDEQQLELLRSVRDGLPIGSLMLWETHKGVTASDRLGERRLTRSTASIHRYLLDGQQRMATLYAALVPLEGGEPPSERTAYFDMVADDFVLSMPVEAQPCHLALSVILDSIKLRRVQRAFPDEVAEVWITRSDAVASAFKDYKVAVIAIATEELDVAIKTFERVNTQGTQMSGVHMINALSFAEDFHLLDTLEALRQELLSEIGWGELDDERILDACRLRLGLPLDGTLNGKLAAELRNNPQVLRESVEDISRAATFLRDKCDVRSPRLLPFRQQLLVLSVAFREDPTPTEDVQGRLIAWFWGSTLTAWFAGEGTAARTRLRDSLDEIVDIGRGVRKRPFGARERSPLGLTFNSQSSRGRTLVLLLDTLRPRLPSHAEVDLRVVLEGDRIEIPWMIPRLRMEDDHASPGNRFLMPLTQIPQLRYLLQNSKTHPWTSIEDIAKSHAITAAARTLLVQGDERGFVNARRQDLEAYEERFLQSHLDALK